MLHEPVALGLLQAALYAAYAVSVSYYIHDDASRTPPGSIVVMVSECLKALFTICSFCLWRANAPSCHAIQQLNEEFYIEDASIENPRDQADCDTTDLSSCCTQQQTPPPSISKGTSTNTSQLPAAFRVLVTGKRRIYLDLINQEEQTDSTTAGESWPCSLLRFIPVALAYCISDNISIYTLGLVQPYSYTLLSALKVPGTTAMAPSLLHCKVELQILRSMGIIVLGVCIGQFAAYRAVAANIVVVGFNPVSFIYGNKLLLCAVALSAAASTYHERLRRQNRQQQQCSMDFNSGRIELACLGTLCSFVYCYLQPYALSDALSTFRAVHWAAAASLAAAGILPAMSAPSSSSSSSEDVELMHPTIFKMYGLVIAPLFTALACRVLHLHHVPLLFYIGAGVSLVGLLRVHYTQSHSIQRAVACLDKKLGDCGGWRPIIFKIWKYALYLKICVLVLLPLLTLAW